MEKNFKHIELFAGCGGMSLGLEAAGFDLFFANELSPMAGETFAYNILGEALEQNKNPQKVLWLSSKFEKGKPERLKENPFEFSSGTESDLKDVNNIEQLDKKLLIGDIKDLVSILEKEENEPLVRSLREKGVDLVSGGPPCQGFSLAGKRIKDDHKNSLPEYFAKFVSFIKPRIVLLENVKGITAPFKVGDEKFYAWVEVSKAFIKEGYIPVCMMLNSKYFGVAQNRPRFILLGLREDVFERFISKSPEIVKHEKIARLRKLYYEVKESGCLDILNHRNLPLIDIEKDKELYNGELLPNITHDEGDFVSVREAINDLRTAESNCSLDDLAPNSYVDDLEQKYAGFKSRKGKSKLLLNHEYRSHTFPVRARFRYYQILNELDLNGERKEALQIFSEPENETKVRSVFKKLAGRKFYDERNGVKDLFVIESYNEFKRYIKKLATKKHSQRALVASYPAPAQLTIPDDLCHYDPEQLRTMTVREMARIQSFPDWFVFKSKVTTGGKQRSFQVPQYTQVGNAVPPLLAYQLGNTVSNILKKVKNG